MSAEEDHPNGWSEHGTVDPSVTMTPVGGKRAGARRGRRAPRRLRPKVALLAVAITLLVVAWGYLVYAAIDFGSAARGGEGAAWGFLLLASAGAVACLFIGLLLLAQALRELGLTVPPPATAEEPAEAPPRVAGGRRAAR